jgi:hypothetical protein
MSEILIGSTNDPNVATVLPETAEEKAKQVPDPSGYRILCAVPEVEGSYESGILKSDMSLRHEELLTTVLFVVKMGPVFNRSTHIKLFLNIRDIHTMFLRNLFYSFIWF